MTLCIDRIVLSVSHWYYCPTSLSRPFFSTLIINLSSSFLQPECVGIIQDLPGTKIFKGYCIFWFEKLPVESNKKSRQYCLFYSCTGSVVFWLEQISFNNFSVESNKKSMQFGLFQNYTGSCCNTLWKHGTLSAVVFPIWYFKSKPNKLLVLNSPLFSCLRPILMNLQSWQ